MTYLNLLLTPPLLTRCHDVNALSLYPWIHQYSNNRTNDDQLRGVTFPDLDPSEIPPTVRFSMAAGDFLDIYQDPGLFNLTCITVRERLLFNNRAISKFKKSPLFSEKPSCFYN